MANDFPTQAQVLAKHAIDDMTGKTVLCACDIDFSDRYLHAEHQVAMWSEACTISTAEQLDAVPVGAVVHSRAGTIAARFDATRGVVFGDDRPFPWMAIALPAQLIWQPAS